MSIVLNRFCICEMGTFGKLIISDNNNAYGSWYTVELPWKNNEHGISCIPLGEYDIIPTMFKGEYRSYEIIVPNRTAIKIHIANTISDLKGCIGLGKKLGVLPNRLAVLNSVQAYKEFTKTIDTDRWAVLNSAQAYKEFMKTMNTYYKKGDKIKITCDPLFQYT